MYLGERFASISKRKSIIRVTSGLLNSERNSSKVFHPELVFIQRLGNFAGVSRSLLQYRSEQVTRNKVFQEPRPYFRPVSVQIPNKQRLENSWAIEFNTLGTRWWFLLSCDETRRENLIHRCNTASRREIWTNFYARNWLFRSRLFIYSVWIPYHEAFRHYDIVNR